MVRARVTSKGQVTLPAEMRRQLDIKPGDDVDFVMEEKATYVNVVKRKKLMDLYGSLKIEGPPITKKEIREAAAKAAVERHERVTRQSGGDE